MSTPTLLSSAPTSSLPFYPNSSPGLVQTSPTNQEPRSNGIPSPVRRRGLIVLGLTLIVSVFVLRCLDVAHSDSITSDETTHLVHCLHYRMTRDDLKMWELGAAPFPHALGGVASSAAMGHAGVWPTSTDPIEIERRVLSGTPHVLIPARVVAILWGSLLVVSVYWATQRHHGAWAGLVAAAIVSFA